MYNTTEKKDIFTEISEAAEAVKAAESVKGMAVEKLAGKLSDLFSQLDSIGVKLQNTDSEQMSGFTFDYDKDTGAITVDYSVDDGW